MVILPAEEAVRDTVVVSAAAAFSEAGEHRERRRRARRLAAGRRHRCWRGLVVVKEEAWRLAGALQQPGVLPAAEHRLGGGERGGLGEVELGAGAAEAERGGVVGARGGLGGVEGPQPHARRLVRVADLRRPLPPRPLPHAAVPLPAARAGGRRGREPQLPARARRLRRCAIRKAARDVGHSFISCMGR
jgi:hypothetical protein